MTIIKHQKCPLNQSSVIGYFAVFMMIIYIVLPISICTVNIYFFLINLFNKTSCYSEHKRSALLCFLT